MPLTGWSRWFKSAPSRRRPRPRAALKRWNKATPPHVELLEDRALPAGNSLLTAMPILPTGTTADSISAAGAVDFFTVTLTESGRFTARAQSAAGLSLDTRTSLLEHHGRLLIQSDGESTTSPDDRIVQHLPAGTYYLRVEGAGGGTGDYALTTQFHPATPPDEPLLVNFARAYPYALVPPFLAGGDFNGDGHLDVATANTFTDDVSILLGLGDGSFQPARNFAAGTGPFGITTADFDGDGRLDLGVANQFSNDVSILLGRGDGTFAPERRVTGGEVAWGLTAGDFDNDRRPDLAISNYRAGSLSILLGRGDGTFGPERRFAAGDGTNGVSAADLNVDGRLDLVAANFDTNDISVLLGRGDGTFEAQRRFAVGETPTGEATAGDFDGDGRLDLAVPNAGSGDVSVLLGRGDGTFGDNLRYAAGSSPYAVLAGDFDGDGRLDLATANRQSNDVSVLLGHGDGRFADPVRYRVGTQPWHLIVGDFDGDRRPDLASANARSHDVSVLLGLGDGTFRPDLTDLRPGQTNPQGMVARDFNGDGRLDLAAVSYTGGHVFVFLGRGDGTFQGRMRFGVGSTPDELVAGDFNGDGFFDLATVNCDSGDLSVLLGRGDGTFGAETRYPSSPSGEWVLTADFDRDGALDLVASGHFANGIAVVRGRGDGTFGDRRFIAPDEAPADGVTADFDGDGRLDLATTNFFSSAHDISVHRGRGDGTFEAPAHFAVGDRPFGLVTGDFNRDGRADLANANFGSKSVSVLLGRGDGTFASEVRYVTGPLPDFLLTRDVDADGILDLVVSNSGSDGVSVLLGRGDGTFQDEVRYVAGNGPTPRRGLDAGDFDGDGRLDLAIPQVLSNDVAILPGSGDGRFQPPLRSPVGLGPVAFVTGDFSGDGRIDLASVNPTTNELAVSLGVGDTTLQKPVRFATGPAPVAVARGDFNRDGRPDLVTANHGSGDVSVFLGLGTGSFRDGARFAVGANPVALAAGDLNGDGLLDLAAANASSNDVSLLLGRGDGTFQPATRFATGDLPQALAAGDFNSDGRLDLAAANYRSNTVALLLGRGNGTFDAPVSLAAGRGPVALLADDFDGDGRLDLATANYRSHDVTVLFGRGGGTFHGPAHFAAGTNPVSLTASDFNGDGVLDLATANSLSDDITILLGSGGGRFGGLVRVAAGDYPAAVVADDFNSDGRADLALASHLAFEVSILPGLGDARFLAPGALSAPLLAAPVVMDWNNDGAADVAVVSRAGDVLLRLARPDTPGTFEAPLLVNQGGPAARDLVRVRTAGGFILAALDARDSSLSFYSGGTGVSPGFTRTAGPVVPGTLSVRLVSGDLSGDGLDDLAVVSSGSAEVFVYVQRDSGFSSLPDYRLSTGLVPSDVALADVDGDRRPDVVVTGQLSGTVSVFRNDAASPFASGGEVTSPPRYRAGTGLYFLDDRSDAPTVRSAEGTARVLAGNFDADPRAELVVTNSGSNSFSVLNVSAAGGLLNPQRELTFPAGIRPALAVAGRFNDDPYPDLAVLNAGSGDLAVYLNSAAGAFTERPSLAPDGRPGRPGAGNLPSGLSAHDVTGDGRLDLLVGNEFGDLLTLLGNGDGTFQPYQRAGRNVALAVADLNNDGQEDFVFGNEARDRVSVQYSRPGQTFAQERTDGVLAPGAVSAADLNGDGWTDLVIANGGANNVLAYLGSGGGQFGPARSFFAGTNPVGLTVRDLNGDTRPDLVVANEGSNDVTVLLGQGQGGGWTLTPGPRLRAGAAPVSTTVEDVNNDAIPDLLVSNSRSNDVFLLPGVGGGFFNDQAARIFNTGLSPRLSLPGNFDAVPGLDLVTVNAGSNNLTFFSNFTAPASVGVSFASGGLGPIAALGGDFNADGRDDLLVAHNGNGAISLLFGRQGGLALREVRSLADVARPTALALAGASATGLEVFVAGEDAEAVRRLAFLFDLGGISLTTAESLLPPNGGRGLVADLLPFQDATAPLIVALLTVGLEGGPPGRGGVTPPLAADPREGDFVERLLLLLDPAAELAIGTRADFRSLEDFGSHAGGDEPVSLTDEDVLMLFVTGEKGALEDRGPVSREELLNPMKEPGANESGLPDLGRLLDDWLGEASASLDAFWERVSDGALRLGEASTAALRLAAAPMRGDGVTPPLPLSDLRLREVVDAIARSLLEAFRPAADPRAVPLAPPEAGQPPAAPADNQPAGNGQPAAGSRGGVTPPRSRGGVTPPLRSSLSTAHCLLLSLAGAAIGYRLSAIGPPHRFWQLSGRKPKADSR